jgi:hypothetical protein
MLYGQAHTITLEDATTLDGYRVKIPYPEKSAVVRLPTDQEVAAYSDLPHKEDDRTPEVDLFAKLLLHLDGDAFDEYECAYIINNLLSVSATGCVREGHNCRVTLKTPFGEVVNVLRMPSIKEITLFRSAVVSENAKGVRTAHVSLFDKLQQSSEGYADGFQVPLFHKAPCIGEVYAQLVKFDAVPN